MSEKLKVLVVAGILLLVAGIWFFVSADRGGEVLLSRGAGAAPSEPAREASLQHPEESRAPQVNDDLSHFSETESTGTILVHVCGAVCRPGVYELSAKARKAQAIEAAGGFAEDADDAYINLAAGLTDGEQLRVPLKSETAGLPAVQTETGSDLVNINTADLAGLMRLPGIGEAKARAIIEYRTVHGRFAQPSDIMEVSGIKEALFETIKHLITV